MSSKDDDNFDLYDDPYVATGRHGGGADPYAEDDDDYYNGDHGRGHDGARRDRFQNTRDISSISSVAAKSENIEGDSRKASEDQDGYGHYRTNSNDQGDSKSYGASSTSTSSAYDPAQTYGQQDQKNSSSSYQSSSQYSSQSSYQDSKSYSNQQSPQSSQQQQQQQQSSSGGGGGGRELG
jgi:hypothetical protein